MSYLIAAPEQVASAATDLAGIGSTISEANAAAAVPTTGVLAPAGDQVSAAVASLFSGHGQAYQALSAQVSAFHNQFVQDLTSAAGSYAGAEAANASPLQTVEQGLLNAVNAPTQTLLGRPLIGDGAAGAPGGTGGLLYGNGGPGGAANAAGGTGGWLWGNGGPAGSRGPLFGAL